MPKKDNLSVSGYIPDIKENKPFLQTYNRHSDSYSVFDLKPEIILISSRISHLLCSLEAETIDSDLNWREIVVLVEIKRKLIETISKASEIAFRHQQMERMNDARIEHMRGTKLPLDDVKEIIQSMFQSAGELMTEDGYQTFVKKVQLTLDQAEKKNAK